jgi:hypothetical protein
MHAHKVAQAAASGMKAGAGCVGTGAGRDGLEWMHEIASAASCQIYAFSLQQQQRRRHRTAG